MLSKKKRLIKSKEISSNKRAALKRFRTPKNSKNKREALTLIKQSRRLLNTCQKKNKRSQNSKRPLKMKYKVRKNLKMVKKRRRGNTETTL